MGIVVGSVVEGVTRVQDLGIQVGTGLTISLGFVWRCSSRTSRRRSRRRPISRKRLGSGRLGQLWFLAVLACGVAAALGFLATDVSGTVQGDRAAASLREGSLLLTNSLMPFSFERGARLPARPRPLSSLPLGAEQLTTGLERSLKPSQPLVGRIAHRNEMHDRTI
jgi:zinc transporter, ZIP family